MNDLPTSRRDCQAEVWQTRAESELFDAAGLYAGLREEQFGIHPVSADRLNQPCQSGLAQDRCQLKLTA
jgi:hypothetical protein